MDYSNFEEFFNTFYSYASQENSSSDENIPPGVADEACRNGNSDIPNGFQDLPPNIYVLMGELLGNIIGAKLPFNIQNSVGNWLQLVGQAILVFNSQQQYFEGGPGRYYNPIYRNATNPFCPQSTPPDDSGNNVSNTPNPSNNTSNFSGQPTIADLEARILILERELRALKNSNR